jgi:hypothetical protein
VKKSLGLLFSVMLVGNLNLAWSIDPTSALLELQKSQNFSSIKFTVVLEDKKNLLDQTSVYLNNDKLEKEFKVGQFASRDFMNYFEDGNSSYEFLNENIRDVTPSYVLLSTNYALVDSIYEKSDRNPLKFSLLNILESSRKNLELINLQNNHSLKNLFGEKFLKDIMTKFKGHRVDQNESFEVKHVIKLEDLHVANYQHQENWYDSKVLEVKSEFYFNSDLMGVSTTFIFLVKDFPYLAQMASIVTLNEAGELVSSSNVNDFK